MLDGLALGTLRMEGGLETPNALLQSLVKSGHVVKVRFEPNELGKVAFAGTRLRREGAELLLERHDRLLRFRPEGRGCLGR